jgi:hypothetical protein
VWGEVCYPSDILPPITIYFQNVGTLEIIYHALGKGGTPYRVELPGGVYIAFAWPNDRYFAIAYTEYVRCGGGERCTDHSLVPFLVRPGNVTTGVDICDREADVDGLPPLQ